MLKIHVLQIESIISSTMQIAVVFGDLARVTSSFLLVHTYKSGPE